MLKSELIKLLEEIPEDLPVCGFDEQCGEYEITVVRKQRLLLTWMAKENRYEEIIGIALK